MKSIKVLLLVALLIVGHYWWDRRPVRTTPVGISSTNGFVDAVMPQGAPSNTVIILAPVNCPSDAARRADNLADQLKRMDIPAVRRAEYSVHFIDASPEQEAGMQRAVEVLKGDIPAVFINGRAKANPTADDVVAEFRRSR